MFSFKQKFALSSGAILTLGIFLLPSLTVAASPAAAPKGNAVTPASTPLPTLSDYFNVQISADELKAAGFAEPVAIAPTKTRFLPPVYYFRVKNIPAGATGDVWGDAKSLVSVQIRPMTDKKWVYNNGDIQLVDLAGRFQARVASPGHYLVVTGPDKDKTVTLIHNLKVLY